MTPQGWVYTHEPALAHHSPPSLVSIPSGEDVTPLDLHQCVCTRVYAMDSKLRAKEWKSGILKALGKFYAISLFATLSTSTWCYQESGLDK